MANQTTTAQADYDAVVEQLAALRADMAKLAGTVQKATGNRHDSLATDLSDGVTEAVRHFSRQAKANAARLEGAVATHPYVAMGMAAGIGLLIGAMTRR
jgi:ElaB/YqjD/DUF883 family membrane-anchored ribosome-binding protein